MIRALVAVVAVAACNGTAERQTTATGPVTSPPRASSDARPAPLDPGPPPARDCSLLAPAIDRIIAAEIADIRKTRPADVAPLAEAEATATGAALTAAMPKLCEADQWSGAYTACIAAAKVRDDARACQVHLTPDQKTHLDDAMKAAGAVAGSIGIPECDEWQAIVGRIQVCDKFPPESRDAIRKAVDQSMEAWRQAALTPEARTSVASACKQAVDAMKQSMTAMGCPM